MVSAHQRNLSCLNVYQAAVITVERQTIGPTPAHSPEIRAGVEVEVADGGETARAGAAASDPSATASNSSIQGHTDC